jgi:alanine racemase
VTRRIDRALQVAGLPPLERSVWVEVDIDGLVVNAELLVSRSEPAALAPVVKADGYGHGLEMAARSAIAGGAQWLCVADSSEAIRLRNDGYEGPVLVLYPVPASVVAKMAAHRIHVTVGALDEARSLSSLIPKNTPPLSVQIEVDTGMTRGGVAADEVVDTATVLVEGAATRLAGVWTHFAAPEDPTATANQMARFERVLSLLAAADVDSGVVHAAASGGMLASDTSTHDLIRPGLSYYGLHPDAGEPLPSGVGPALAIRAHPVRIADIPAGTAVGYAGTWTAERPSRIATLPVGYADGWSRVSSPGCFALVEGERAPLVGRVSSDSLAVDVTDVAQVDIDSEFTLLGGDGREAITAEEIARVRETITWEVLQQLGSRLSRVYISEGSPVALRPESSLSVIPARGAAIPAY